MIAGIDYSTRYVDIVLLDEDTDAATWHRFPLEGQDAFDRARNVREALFAAYPLWEDVLAVGIEEPRGYNAGALYRVQGAILACLPRNVLVQPWVPSAWRKAVGLPGDAPKGAVSSHVRFVRDSFAPVEERWDWPQDACDAYCIALATRSLIQVTA